MRAAAVILVVLGVAACTKRNPEVCCSNAVECDRFGFDEITPCLGFEVCVEGECEAPTCTTSADCRDPAPYCVDTVCVANCVEDASCAGTSTGPYCAPTGSCVECLDSTQCVGSGGEICDQGSLTCRGCTADDECESGICLAAEGVCATVDQAVFVATDGIDTGDCTSAAPCASVPFGLSKLTGERRVLRIPSLDFSTVDGIVLDRDVYLDGAGTRVGRTGSVGAVVLVENEAVVTLEGIRLVNAQPDGVSVRGGAHVTAYDVELDQSVMSVADVGSELDVVHALATSAHIECTFLGSIRVRDSEFVRGYVFTDYCRAATVHRNRFRDMEAGWAIQIDQAFPAIVENNVITANGAAQGKFLRVSNVRGSAGSVPATVRFNTMVNTNPTSATTLIDCFDDVVAVFSSNLVLAHSPNAITGGACVVDHSLFDDETGAPPGTGNLTAPIDSIVVDLTGGDLRPSAASAARGAADPGQAIADDFAGNPRPLPAGTTADVGAFEVD